MEREPRVANRWTASKHHPVVAVPAQRSDDLRCALRNRRFAPGAVVDGGLASFGRGFERHVPRDMDRRVASRHGREDGVVDRIVILSARRQRRRCENVCRCNRLVQDGRCAGPQDVAGQRPGLVRAQHIHAAELFDGGKVRDDRFPAGQRGGTDCHRHRQHCRERDRDRCDCDDERERQGFQRAVTARQRHHDDDAQKCEREHDQVVTDPQHRPLKMAHPAGLFDECGGPAVEAARTGREHQEIGIASSDD